jgi:hypothetical protein
MLLAAALKKQVLRFAQNDNFLERRARTPAFPCPIPWQLRTQGPSTTFGYRLTSLGMTLLLGTTLLDDTINRIGQLEVKRFDFTSITIRELKAAR